MKLGALLALPLAGCALYFGSDDPPTGFDPPITDDPVDPDDPVKPPPDQPPPPPPPPASCGTPEVHVIGIYETSSNHDTTGEARVAIERPGLHVLVLSAYEATNWHVRLAPTAKLKEIRLLGYERQTVDVTGVPVTHGGGCGYSYPYNGGGCDTNALLAGVKAHTGVGLTSFHGCYQASQWRLHADRTVTSNCNTAAGYEVDELLADCGKPDPDPGPGPVPGPSTWERFSFGTLSPAACSGQRFIRFDAKYNLWVGAIQCGSPNSYKLYLSRARHESFLEIADFAGHGQDHCELVNPAFKIPDEDDITSGGCSTCAVGQVIDIDGIPVYARAQFGQPFQRVQARFWADLTTNFYACGVTIP